MLTGTPNFSVAEAVRASGGSIPADLGDNAQSVLNWLQAARTYIGLPFLITSLYRSPDANADTNGAASDSEHLRALAADFDVLGMTNHAAAQKILEGVGNGAIPAYHQLITYTTDHHLHIGVAGEEWGSDQDNLVEYAGPTYVEMTPQLLASLVGSLATTVKQVVAQAADVGAAHPGVSAAVVALFLLPALVGGHWA